MSLFKSIGAAVRRRIHERDIREILSHYERSVGERTDIKQSFADAGTFRSNVERLFALGNAAETAELKRLGEAAVSNTITNRFYRAADYLSDVLDELERTTYFTGEPDGEAPLATLEEQFQRELKMQAVYGAWLVPLKVGSIETAIAAHSNVIGRRLPYQAIQNFERAVARLFALAEQSERKLVQDHIGRFLTEWCDSEAIRDRFTEPADAIADALSCLTGELTPDGLAFVRTRRHDQPLRLTTLVPEDRQHYLRAALKRWEDAS